LASLVPLERKICLNIDFAGARKMLPGSYRRMGAATRQFLPACGKICRAAGQITPLLKKDTGKKSRKSLGFSGSGRNSAW
jgi:hypothetical protein